MNIILATYLKHKSDCLVVSINRQRKIHALLYNKKYVPITKEETKTYIEYIKLFKEFKRPHISYYE